MIPITPKLPELDVITRLDSLRRLTDNLYHNLIKQRLAILYRKHNMVVYLPCTVACFLDLTFTHAPILGVCVPAARLRGIAS